ncbi:uncharacterized protein YidB (DUF937 family) [Chitinivorax tropicus]|uniref:Uncharacterized protein YidB (DUF937 family) n=1 Tax=Chitinivorax tropicus TaxID=714531 RepID=A0A840MSV0_9PROT|nr:YidB family protein [Chitinivorax tropicus]MBB5019353.1 uncharacterized protein YidB (DUF937 family) [Chitinivorax tropicus]
MGLFDELAGAVAGQPDGSGLSGLVSNLLGQGGLQNLVGLFEQQGLGNLIQSWIGTGDNLPVSADQLQQVLGNSQIGQMASQLGVAPEQLTGQLAGLLPQVIDKLTPNGQIEESGGLLDMGLDLLKSRLLG